MRLAPSSRAVVNTQLRRRRRPRRWVYDLEPGRPRRTLTVRRTDAHEPGGVVAGQVAEGEDRQLLAFRH